MLGDSNERTTARLVGLLLLATMIVTGSASSPPARASDLKSDEEVVVFPTFAPLGADPSHVELPIHAWVYERRDHVALPRIGEMLGLDATEKTSKLFFERAAPFLYDNERDKSPQILFRGKFHPLNPTGADGHSETIVRVDAGDMPFEDRAFIDFSVRDRPFASGRAQLIGPKGWSVVSDLDDTIKLSNVLDKKELARNTFVRSFEPISGMAKFFRAWEEKGAVFHYVSGSPWQLYEPLARFVKTENFPRGTLHLRKFRIKDRSAVQFFSAPEEYKISTIEPILAAFPERKFILVGDSGERDPEVYGELARRRPKQIAVIAIRNITAAKLDDARMQAALRDVDPKCVVLFKDAGELEQLSLD